MTTRADRTADNHSIKTFSPRISRKRQNRTTPPSRGRVFLSRMRRSRPPPAERRCWESGHRWALWPSCRVPDLFFGYHYRSEVLGRLGTMASIPARQVEAQGEPEGRPQVQSDLPEE